MTNFNWNATAFFERLTASNKLAQQEHFAFLRVSGLEGLEEALHTLQRHNRFRGCVGHRPGIYGAE